MSTPAIPQNQVGQGPDVILPTLFGVGYHNYDARPNNFIFSMVAHVLAALLLLFGGQFIWKNRVEIKQKLVDVADVGSIVLPPSPTAAGGGGGGGDHSKLAANKGTPPKFDLNRITPPATVIKNDNPKLAVEQAVAVLPSIKLPTSKQVGDPLSNALILSNGTGVSSGVGSGAGGGLGSGSGVGLGPGSGGNTGGGVFRIGGGVSAPKLVYQPEPEFSEEARKAKYQGTVTLSIVVGADGRPRDIKVLRPLGMGLDEKAIEAVRQYRFEPAMKNGQAVAVYAAVEVDFRLY
jgi:TonB family protein